MHTVFSIPVKKQYIDRQIDNNIKSDPLKTLYDHISLRFHLPFCFNDLKTHYVSETNKFELFY
jgi:hypothetical protein